MKALQYFSEEYLEQCKKMKPGQILRFLEDFRLLHGGGRREKSKLISLKVPENLLQEFKRKAETRNVKYQTQIKLLMEAWLSDSDSP